jgi:acid phosphatase
MMRIGGILIGLIAAAILQCSCGGGSAASSGGVTSGGGTTGSGGSTGSGTSIPKFTHAFLVIEENHSYSAVIGSSSMPYLNGLASANGLATQYYADTHPSLPNYFMLTAGATLTGSQGDGFSGVVTQDNVVRALTAAGKTWKCYAEALPSVGYLGSDVPPYAHHHNPFVYFSDVQDSSTQASNIVPITQLATDIANNTLPDYAFIVPDLNDDAHDCPPGMTTCTDAQVLTNTDNWLSATIGPLLASTAFQNSVLIVTFDESTASDIQHGGGQVATVIVSPLAKAGYQSTTLYQHESTLRLMMEGLSVTDLPGAAATAPDMTEFFK